MPERSGTEPESPQDPRDARARSRAKRAADSLGDLLPDASRDESPEAWGDRERGARDDDLLRDVPPHHG